jgi:ferric-dicitrate binding protein FerR (iron transport regulator)
MAGGATLVVEGPTRLQLTGAASLKLDEGKTAVRIVSPAESFVVDAPAMQVVDLGTEFGVEASAAGDSRVMVFDGTVALNDV